MNLNKLLANRPTKTETQELAKIISQDADLFDELIQLFIAHSAARTSVYIGMLLVHIVDTNPDLLIPYLGQLVANLKNEKLTDATKRGTVRCLQSVDIPKYLWGDTLDICFTYLSSPQESIAVRTFSMTVLWNICKKETVLLSELRMTIEDWIDYDSKGFQSRAKKILKSIAALEKKS